MRYLVLISMVILMGCEKIISLDAEYKTPKLVINGGFDPYSEWDIHISHSQSVLDNGQISGIENATVSIYDENGVLVESLTHTTGGYYGGSSKPLVGKDYRIEVSAPDYTTVRAMNYCHDTADLIFLDSTRKLHLGEELIEYEFRLNDNGGAENYYLIEAEVFGDTIYNISYPVSFYLSELEFENAGPDVRTNIAYLKDNAINGESYEFSFYLDPYYNDRPSQYKYYKIYITSCTYDSYQYFFTYDKYRESAYDPFAQPVQVYSNVENGFGMFGGVTTDTLIIPIKQ